ncbi:MAG: H-type small acid-soluble spore protein [Syntrophomonadaceae bacterium]
MNSSRVKQIIDSPNFIEVLYKGSPVLIQNIDGNRVQIQDMNAEETYEVSANDLVEGKMLH